MRSLVTSGAVVSLAAAGTISGAGPGGDAVGHAVAGASNAPMSGCAVQSPLPSTERGAPATSVAPSAVVSGAAASISGDPGCGTRSEPSSGSAYDDATSVATRPLSWSGTAGQVSTWSSATLAEPAGLSRRTLTPTPSSTLSASEIEAAPLTMSEWTCAPFDVPPAPTIVTRRASIATLPTLAAE